MSDPRVSCLKGLSLPHPSPSFFIIYLAFFAPGLYFDLYQILMELFSMI